MAVGAPAATGGAVGLAGVLECSARTGATNPTAMHVSTGTSATAKPREQGLTPGLRPALLLKRITGIIRLCCHARRREC